MRAPATGGSMIGTRARVRILPATSGENRQPYGALAPETEGRNARPGADLRHNAEAAGIPANRAPQ